jgi:hypothetical protein
MEIKEPEIIESLFELVQSVLDDDITFKICDLLGLDPYKVNAITIEAEGMFQGKKHNVLTVKRIKER